MIFVSIKERLKMPENMIGHIVERNISFWSECCL